MLFNFRRQATERRSGRPLHRPTGKLLWLESAQAFTGTAAVPKKAPGLSLKKPDTQASTSRASSLPSRPISEQPQLCFPLSSIVMNDGAKKTPGLSLKKPDTQASTSRASSLPSRPISEQSQFCVPLSSIVLNDGARKAPSQTPSGYESGQIRIETVQIRPTSPHWVSQHVDQCRPALWLRPLGRRPRARLAPEPRYPFPTQRHKSREAHVCLSGVSETDLI